MAFKNSSPWLDDNDVFYAENTIIRTKEQIDRWNKRNQELDDLLDITVLEYILGKDRERHKTLGCGFMILRDNVNFNITLGSRCY